MLAVFLSTASVYADEVDEQLSATANEQIRAATRQMIQTGIDGEQAIHMTRQMLANRFEEQQVLRAQRMVGQARKEGLPVSPLMDKAYEGMAKRVEAGNILKAMERVRARYAFAFEQAKMLSSEEGRIEEIGQRIAQCLTAGAKAMPKGSDKKFSKENKPGNEPRNARCPVILPKRPLLQPEIWRGYAPRPGKQPMRSGRPWNAAIRPTT